MKILFCLWGSLCESGMINAINNLGYDLIIFDRKYNDSNYDKDYFLSLANFIKDSDNIDCVLSINFTPIIARACKPFNIPYISLTADCPCSNLYSKTIEYPNNRIFLFDKLQVEKYQQYNPTNIHHLPLATDTITWDKISLTKSDIEKYSSDVSFVGSLYTEMCPYNKISHLLNDETKGYVDGLIAAQQNVYGYYFIEDAISEGWVRSFQRQANLSSVEEDYFDDIRGIIADNYIGYKCTEQERTNTLATLSQHFNVDLWTLSDSSNLPRINNRGPADSGTDMPKIFKCSKINLNMTNRAIRSGIPLRILDIMGCGGFLITNYQTEILDYFIPDEDIVIYDSIPDLVNKIHFYLNNDAERARIAFNGYNKVKQLHTYENRLEYMLKASGLL